MEDKKSFFELLDPKSALLVGLVGGILSLGTIGFVVLGFLTLRGAINLSGGNASVATTVTTQPTATAPTQPAVIDTTPPPVIKANKPKVELFVMSYCPFGLQMQKALVPAWNLLKDKADISMKYVSYAMHGQKEIDENTRQYCIEKDQPTKYLSYLSCFTATGDATSCGQQASVNERQVSSCVAAADKTYKISANFNDQTTWLSGQYPLYSVHADLNEKYGVRGSPTMVINGQEVNVARSPEAVKQAICASFNTAPAECDQALPNVAYVPSFGTQIQENAGGAAPGCAT